MAAVSLVVATEAASFDTGGGAPVYLRGGSIWRSDNPVVKARPGLFAPLCLALDGEPDLDTAEVTVAVTGGAHHPQHGVSLLPVATVRIRPVRVFAFDD